MLGIIGRKMGMVAVFDEAGTVVPVTVIRAESCRVVQQKTLSRDGYNAIQLGAGAKKRASKPLTGHCAKAGVDPCRRLVEFRVDDPESYELGQAVTVEEFAPGDVIDVTGWSKGKGFTGVVKKHGYSGGPKSHGSMSHAVPGSIGSGTNPGRVWKGKGLPGRVGNRRRTVRNLRVVEVVPDQNLLLVKGAVPGARNGYLLIRKRRAGAGRKSGS
ncbi:50S ribosomal protein L3 [candidate division TA06 bacterium DG_24]|jgi:large subunit ribosomal protein L3|uniref:Large ribosomal subunit protein uL3 n=3 Tax=Bacteria division TA06 TaxID=1156500 RepID=A0A0S8JK42_UNCT6|nr:MAG: 50S ribosomal protein L3 [candidate division TA06 bacterium DG_24]KPK70913.1 MAG: 50S ribosomal protein L3 [candidate division TA06 bacterium SM23_40]KPL09587.1 MAG: 50S ribosomal protein L3 [candidate division TA06 bacterium SM1_40]